LVFVTPAQQIWTLSMLLVSGFALWRGGRPERWVAVANVLAWILTPLAYRNDLIDPQWGVFLVDVAFLVLLAALAMTTDRNWLLFAAAFQLLAVMTHIAIAVDRGVRTLAYFRGLVIWSYLVLGALAVGAWMFRRDPRRPAPPKSET
jgi:hypothetical protein